MRAVSLRVLHTFPLLSSFGRTEVYPEASSRDSAVPPRPPGSAPPPRVPSPGFPRGRLARLGLPPGAAPRPRSSALCAARLRHRHAEIPEVPPRQPSGHAAARPSLLLPSALGFPVHRPSPLLLGATRRQNLPLTLCQHCPTPRFFPTRCQTKEPRENLPELQRKSLIQSFLGLFNF